MATSVATPKPAAQRLSTQQILTALGPFLGLGLVILLFSLVPAVRPYFLSPGNFALVATQTVIVALGALGMTLIIISGGIDLSVGSVIALASVATALLLVGGQSVVVALLAATLVGGVVGAVNGGLITSLKVTPFIVTLGTLGIARGVAKWMAHNNAVSAPASSLNQWLTPGSPHTLHLRPPHLGPLHFLHLPSVSLTIVPLPGGVWLTIVLAILTAILLKRTIFGRYIFALGSNETASRLSGLPVDALKIGIYALAGLFFGLAGVLQTARLRQGDPTVATGLELDIIAAVVIGGGSLSGGEGSILGSLIGALIMGFLRNGSQIIGWPDYTQQIIIGIVIIAAVALDRLRHRKAG